MAATQGKPIRALVLVFGLAGCSSEHWAATRTDGLVRLGGTSGTICLPVNRAGSYTMGFDLLHNSGGQTVTINEVRTVGGSGIAVVESYLIPVAKGPYTLVGVSAWPPGKDAEDESNWGSRTSAVGPDRLDPSDTPLEGWNLVLHLTATGPGATYDDLAVDYSLQGVRYEAVNDVGLEIQRLCF